MDFGKFLFDLSKKRHAAKRKQKQIQVKEIKFRPTTEKGDYDTKLRSAHAFIEDGDKVKVTVRYRGREMAHQELGMQLMDRVRKDLEEVAVVEQYPKMEGRQAVMVLSGKKR